MAKKKAITKANAKAMATAKKGSKPNKKEGKKGERATKKIPEVKGKKGKPITVPANGAMEVDKVDMPNTGDAGDYDIGEEFVQLDGPSSDEEAEATESGSEESDSDSD